MTRRFISARRVCVFALALAALVSSLTLNALPSPHTAESGGKHDTAAGNGTGGNGPVFLVAPSISVAGQPSAIAAGDLNGDGAPDLVVANKQSSNVDVLLGDGKGGFRSPVHYKIGGSPVALALGDFAGHGKVDIAVANQSGNSISILLGNGDGTFQAAVNYTVGAGSTALAVGDFNGDGHADLLVADSGSNTLAVLINKSDGTFQSAKLYAVSASPQALAIADFNGDGKLDVASGNADGTVSIMLGDGAGGLNLAATMRTATQVSALAVGDFNGDGKSDLAVADPVASTVSVYLGRGDGTFQSPSVLSSGNQPVFLALADVNGDGIADLLVANRAGNTVSIMLGAGDGSFQPSSDYVVGNSPVAIAIADFNGDGHLDLATSNSADGTVSVPLGNGDGTLQAAQDYRTHLERKSVAVGDLNGDGHPDVVVASFCGSDPKCAGNGTASVFLSNGKGALKPGSIYSLGKGPVSIALADVNDDKKLDLIAVNRDDATIMVLLGNGDGTFQDGIAYSAGTSPTSVSVGDFNKDGKPDLAVAVLCGSNGCKQQGSVNIFLGNGDGSFKSGANYDVDFSPAAVTVGDVDGDGKLDLVVANSCGKSAACLNGTASVLLGDGKGSFTLKTEVNLGKQVSSIALADLNQDGRLDLIAANSADNQVGILLGNGDGTFNNQIGCSVGVGPAGVVVGDFDGDGLPDVAVANLTNSTVSLLHGNGDGTLKTAVAYPVGLGPDALAALDLTGSGRLALVTANGNGGASPVGNGITLLENAMPGPELTSTTINVTDVSPASEVYGQDAAVTITAVLSWTGNGPAPTASDVTIGGNGNGAYGTTSCGAPSSDTMTCTATYTPTALDTTGSYTETATFKGDGNYSKSSSPQTDNFTVTKGTTTIAVTTVSPASKAYGQDAAVTITAVLSWTGSGTAPTASDVTISGDGNGAYGTTSCGAPSSDTMTCTTTYTPNASDTPGSYTETAIFSGDNNYSKSSSPQTNNFTITKGTTTINVTTVSPASEAYGQDAAVTIMAVLSWTGSGAAPTASDVTIGGNGNGTYGTTSCGVPSSDTTTCTATYTPNNADIVGSYTETATFKGDSNYSKSSSPQTNNFTIALATTSIAVTSVNPASEVYAQDAAVTITAVLSWTGSGPVPTASDVTISGNGHGIYGKTSCGVPSSDTMTCTATYTPNASDVPGSYTETAKFSGDSNYSKSSSPQTNNFTITKAATTITVTNVNPASEVYGRDAAVTITAVLSWTGSGAAPTASDVTIGGNGNGTYGTTSCGVPSSDTTTCTATYTPSSADIVGSYTETATFKGDSNYSASSSPQTNNFTITQATSSTSVTSSVNPSVFQQAVTFTATINGEYGMVERGIDAVRGRTFAQGRAQDVSGTVKWSANTGCAPSTVTLSYPGIATCTTSGLAVGNDAVTATYSGDSNHFGSSGTLTNGQVVDPAMTTMAFTITPSATATSLTFTFATTVSVVAPGTGTPIPPTGTVTLTYGSAPLCTVALTLTSSGTGSCTPSTPPTTGTGNVTSTYSGDGNFTGSAAALPLDFATPASPPTVLSGQPSGTVTLTASAATTGTVSFSCLAISGTGIPGFVKPSIPGVFTNTVPVTVGGVTSQVPVNVSCIFDLISAVPAQGTSALTICTAYNSSNTPPTPPQPANCIPPGGTVGVMRPNMELKPRLSLYSVGLFLPGIVFLGIGGRFAIGLRRRKFDRLSLIAAIGILLVVSLLLMLPACGGGFSGSVQPAPTNSGDTPVGTYTLTIQGLGTDGSVEIYTVAFTVSAPH